MTNYDVTEADVTLALREVMGLPAMLTASMTAVHAVSTLNPRVLADAADRARRTKIPSIFLPIGIPGEQRAFVFDTTGGGGPYFRVVHLWASVDGGAVRVMSGDQNPLGTLIVGRTSLRRADIKLAKESYTDIGIERADRLLREAAARHWKARLAQKTAA